MKARSTLSHLKREAVNSFQAFLAGGSFPAYPLEIFLEVSNVCNMKCAMCSVFSELNPKRWLALKSSERGFLPDQHIHALEPLLSHALLVHCFGYGEPTIHPRFAELLDFLLDKEVLVDFFTNGMNLTEALCNFLVERSVFRITVSFSGACKEDYENMYLDGHYETVLAGIERIAQHKARRGTVYPSIEINSIAFQHHVDRLPTFVEQMAAHGVNAINLKPLHLGAVLPALHQHAAVMRPWHEGKLIEEARRLANQHGIHFADEFSNVAAVASPDEETRVRERLLWGAESLSDTAIPLGEFKSLAKMVKPIMPPKRHESPTPCVTAMDHTPETIRSFLNVKPLETPPNPMCYEPFKTLYVNQQGGVRPCCFGFTHTYLGHLDSHPAKRIWNGIGFNTVRRVMTRGRYPMHICKACLKQKSYPKQLNFRGMVDAYAGWYKQLFGQTFRSDASCFAQLFVDTGAGFNETDSVIQPITPDREQHLEFDVSRFPVVVGLRFDPINTAGRVTILEMTAVRADGEASSLHVVPLNASTSDARGMLFDVDDPQGLIEGFSTDGCRTIRVALRCHVDDAVDDPSDMAEAF